jgi:hypothetical protein
MLSAEWERVDLPNLNNGVIKGVIYLNDYYYLKKWDNSFVRSKDLLEWEENTDTLNIAKSLKHERNDYNLIISLDDEVYSYIGNMLYSSKNEKLDSVKIDNLDTFENGIIVFKYNDELQIFVRLRKPKTFDYYLFTTEIVNDSLRPKKVIKNSLNSNINSKPILTKDFLISSGSPNPIAIDLRTKDERIFDIIIPDNTYINEYHIIGDTLRIYDFLQMKHIEYSLTKNSLYCNDFTKEYGYGYVQMHDIWNLKFNITELLKKSDKGEYISKFQFNIYDSNEILVKVIDLGENYYSNDRIETIYIDKDFAVLTDSGDLLKLNRKDLEIEIMSSTFRKIIEEKNRLIAVSSYGDNITYQYSEDLGDTWKKQSINKELSPYRLKEKHIDLDNSHRLFFINDNVYSFAYDSIYYSKLGSDKLELLGAYENSEVFRSDDILYFLDKSDGKIYSIENGNNIEEIRIDNTDIGKIIEIDLDNGYLYASDYYNLYRFKLENDCSSFFHFLHCIFGCD